jgi:hypothetical protein
MKIAHVINTYKDSAGEQYIQQITLESMKRAKEYAENAIEIELLSAQIEEDRQLVPNYFKLLPNLTRSVVDVAQFKNKRGLPLLKDILDLTVNNSDADYIVYSNADIGVMPQFYIAIKEIIENGVDAFIINRRRVSDKYNSVSQLEQIYTETGEMHNGYDCFVFKKSAYSQFKIGNVCLGIPHVGNTLAFNLMCFANQFRLFTHKHLTFHIGYELIKNWGDKEYLNHNKKEYLKNIKSLSHKIQLVNIPGSSFSFFKRHFKWLMNPTIHYSTMFKIDLKNWRSERYPFNETNKKQKGYYEWIQKKVKLD